MFPVSPLRSAGIEGSGIRSRFEGRVGEWQRWMDVALDPIA